MCAGPTLTRQVVELEERIVDEHRSAIQVRTPHYVNIYIYIYILMTTYSNLIISKEIILK
jgi:hypothetical protein